MSKITKQEIEQVHSIIKKMNNEQLDELWETYTHSRAKLKSRLLYTFEVGELVGINHDKFHKDELFKVTKINRKTITVQNIQEGYEYNSYNVSPELLKKR